MKNPKILSFALLAVLLLCFLHSKTVAAPIIEIDSPSIDVGTIREGGISKIRHVFIIKNRGDENLIINKVKAG